MTEASKGLLINVCFGLYIIRILSSQSINFKDIKVDQTFKLDFGSCSKQNEDQKIFKSIHRRNPDLFIWLGDAIYIDIRADTHKNYMKNIPRFFSLTKNNQFYQKLLKSKTEILGVWDDHDYAGDNSDSSYDLMKFTKPHFLNFIDEPKNSERYIRKRGVYDVKYYRVTKNKVSLHVQIILLDVRSFSTRKGPNAKILGEEQWIWFETQLKQFSSFISKLPSPHLVVIGSGTQIMQTGKFLPGFEFWAQFGKERSRFFALLKKYNLLNYIILSGDVHFGEVSAIDCLLDYPLFEVTSSGLTHFHPKHIRPFLNLNYRNHKGKRHKFRNSGELEINLDFTNKELQINAFVFDVDGNKKIEQTIKFGRNGKCSKKEMEKEMKTIESEEKYITTKMGWWAQEAVQLTNTIWYQILYDYFYDIIKFGLVVFLLLVYIGLKRYR